MPRFIFSGKLPVIFPACLIVIITLLTASQGLAQVSGATLSGNVTDPSGAAIVGAQVSATNRATGVNRVAATDAAGYYSIPNLQLEAGRAVAHTRIGWYRSVINIPHAFAIGSFLDELAHATNKNTKDFILELLGPDHIVDMDHAGLVGKPQNYGVTFTDHPIDTGRYRGVLDLVADKAGWGQKLPERQGQGIAVHRSFLSYVASVVQVEVAPDGTLIIPRVDIAIDAGFIANPDRTRAQMEGATIMSLSNAITSQITFKEGRTEQTNFEDYQVVRMNAAPREIHVHIVPSSASPGGVGEPGVPPVAPALCNAIFAATGQRIRTLPIGTQLTSGSRARGARGTPIA